MFCHVTYGLLPHILDFLLVWWLAGISCDSPDSTFPPPIILSVRLSHPIPSCPAIGQWFINNEHYPQYLTRVTIRGKRVGWRNSQEGEKGHALVYCVPQNSCAGKLISNTALTGPFRRARHSFTNGLLCLASFFYPLSVFHYGLIQLEGPHPMSALRL